MSDLYELGLVSVVIPTYNRDKYICDTLESLKNQTYTNVEVILIDDGSTDNTDKIVVEWRKNNLDAFIDFIYLKLPRNCDEEWAWNIGFNISKGEYIVIHSSDDISHKERIEKQIIHLANNIDVAGVGSGYLAFKDNINNILFDSDWWISYDRETIEKNYKGNIYNGVCTGTFMFRKFILDEIIGFRKLSFGVNDAFFIRDIINNDYIIDNIKENLYYTRRHDDQKSLKMLDKEYQEDKWKRIKERVSIVLPINNDLNDVINTLESISAQTYDNIELIIVDDTLDDNAEVCVKNWYSKYEKDNDSGMIKELIYFKLPRKVGFSLIYNIGSYLTKGEYIAFHGSGRSDKYRIEKQVEYLKNNFSYSVVGTNYDENNEDIKCDYEIEESYNIGYMPCVNINTIMLRSEVINETAGLNKSMRGREDFEFIYRLINNNYIVQNLKEVLYYE